MSYCWLTSVGSTKTVLIEVTRKRGQVKPTLGHGEPRHSWCCFQHVTRSLKMQRVKQSYLWSIIVLVTAWVLKIPHQSAPQKCLHMMLFTFETLTPLHHSLSRGAYKTNVEHSVWQHVLKLTETSDAFCPWNKNEKTVVVILNVLYYIQILLEITEKNIVWKHLCKSKKF